MITEKRTKLDDFTKAYIEAALFSSTGEPFGDCEECGAADKLLYWNPQRRKHDQCLECCPYGKPTDAPHEPPLDDCYSSEDISDAALVKIIADCAKFQKENEESISSEFHKSKTDNEIDSAAGRDFWLTRNGHGAGFWDGDWTEPAATLLTDAAHKFGECNLYPGDDGRLYI